MYYYVHENNTLKERSKLLAIKGGSVEVKNVQSDTAVINVCTREQAEENGVSRNIQR